MTYYFRTSIVLSIFLSLLIVSAACNKNPAAPDKENTSLLTILIEDETGMPLNGIEVSTSPVTVKRITDQNGYVRFENIPPGNYQIIVSREDVPFFFSDILLKKGEHKNLRYMIASKLNINIFVKTFEGEPISGIEVSTSPKTSAVVTDENGRVTLNNIPIRRYTFIVKRYNYNVYVHNKKLIFIDGKIQDLEIIIDSQRPYVRIISPEDQSYQELNNIYLKCEGYDFEDGNLPEESLTWYSNIDGKLGIGRELFLDRLSVGKHLITIVGIDSHQNISNYSVDLNLYYFERVSYFPIPWSGQWIYKYKNPIFTTIGYNGKSETWRLSELQVTMDDINSRSSVINYIITTENKTKYCRYSVVDYFETDNINIYVSKTVEKLTLFNENNVPLERMELETTYNPRILLIKDHIEPIPFSSYESTVNAEVIWYYKDEVYGSKVYTENIALTTGVSFGGYERVETDSGTYNTLTMTITQGETVRKWWLAKGIGIVQLDYNTYDTPQIASLKETNIHILAQENSLSKVALFTRRSSKFSLSRQLKNPPNTPERMLEIRGVLRTFCLQ